MMDGWRYEEGAEAFVRERDGMIVACRPRSSKDERPWMLLGTKTWSPPPPTERYRFQTPEEACRHADQNL